MLDKVLKDKIKKRRGTDQNDDQDDSDEEVSVNLTHNSDKFGLEKPCFPSFEFKSKSSLRIGATDFVLLTIAS